MEFSFKNAEELRNYCANTSCSYCDFKKDCPFYRQKFSESEIYSKCFVFETIRKKIRRKKLEKLLS